MEGWNIGIMDLIKSQIISTKALDLWNTGIVD